MILLTSLIDAKEYLGPAAVALGNFDGVHKGHQELIKRCVEIASEKGLCSAVFTFLNHPVNEMAGKSIVKSIMTLKEKAQAVEAMGIDVMVAIPFESVRTSSPEEFAKDILAGDLHAKHAVCGFNYSFGFKGAGGPNDLVSFGKSFGFDVTVVDEFDIEGKAVSSTRIRQKLEEGDVAAFARLTGRRYSISGRVMQGEKFGRVMGFPTVNLSLHNDMALPMNGVYVTEIYVNTSDDQGRNIEDKYHSVTNVGNKPSVGQFAKNAETHIFSFDKDIYGQEVRVEFIDLLRPEIKFKDISQLSAQIDRDCIAAKKYHGL